MTRFLSHRGESDDAPENTLSAYKLAMERDSDGIELDIRLTADGEAACVHDETIERVSGVRLAVSDATLAALRPIPSGSVAFRSARRPETRQADADRTQGSLACSCNRSKRSSTAGAATARGSR